MELNELIGGFAATLHIEGMALNAAGVAAFEADGMLVRITEQAAGRLFLLEGKIGAPPPEGRDQFERALLKLNAALVSTSGLAVGLDNEDEYVLKALSDYANLSLEDFAGKIEIFLNELERLRGLLGSFVPVSGKPAEDVDVRSAGFMQV